MITRQQVAARIEAKGLVAILRLQDSQTTLPIVEALCAGGVDCIEFTMTTPGALRALEQVTQRYGDEILFGAGTVLDAETARTVITSGARFVVSPALSLPLIEMCHRYGIAVVPGTFTPTEILTAWQAGSDLVKVFPVSAVGPSYLRAVLAPLPQVRIIPTGGITLETAADYVRAGAVAVGLTTTLVDDATVRAGRFDVITQRTARLLADIHAARTE
jgi:2-dehydro-3-deoxyphosphogluconate aldolase/(4S)-4-hydroxy-2-oxoglutarate aldolase